jgi:hypothetical protein
MKSFKTYINEATDKRDAISIDIPLMIRLLELAREDVRTDVELHKIVERLISIRNKGILNMNHYSYIAGNRQQHGKKK